MKKTVLMMIVLIVATLAAVLAANITIQQPPVTLEQRSNLIAPANCSMIAEGLGGIPVQSGSVCDVIVVRQSPAILNMNGVDLRVFTLMNSVTEFMPINASNNSSHYMVMGDFAVLESEMNPVVGALTQFNWTLTGVHNHMILENPKLSFVHWEAEGELNDLIDKINHIFNLTGIKQNMTNDTNATNGTRFNVSLRGSEEVPPVNTSAEGSASLVLNGSMLAVDVSYDGLTSGAVGGHIHVGQPGVNGPIVVDLGVNNNQTSGDVTWTGVLSDDQIADLRSGEYYINVHSESHPGGEIRGQVPAVQ